MKKSKLITLVLITASLASCHKKHKQKGRDWNQPNVYMRSDESAGYSQAYGGGMGNNFWLWYYAFRPYGYYNYGGYGGGGGYVHGGYYSSGISEASNIGHSATKAGIVRGGFGNGFSVSS